MKNFVIKNISPSKYQDPKTSVNKSLKPTEWDNANTEAERGEYVMSSYQNDGLPELYKIMGRSHSEGGTPLQLPSESFVFSKDKSLKIKDEQILNMFGKKKTKPSGLTPADIAKQYEINDYRKILADPNTDSLQRKTAELMIANYNKKLGKLSLIQESKKGFPDGIPHVAMPYINSTGFDPAGLYSTNGMTESPDADNMRFGGSYTSMDRGGMTGGGMYGQYLPFNYAQYGGSYTSMNRGGNPGGGTYGQYLPFNYANYGGSPHYTQMGGAMYYAQDGKSIPAYDPVGAAALQSLSPGIVLPQDQVPGMQGVAGSYYGKFDKKVADANYSWYGKKIDWSDPKQVMDVQNAYNDRMYKKGKAAGLSDKDAQTFMEKVGFVKKPGLPNSLDGKPGLYTMLRMDHDIDPKKTEQAGTVVTKTGEAPLRDIPTQGMRFKPGTEAPAPFWLQDVIQTAGAFGDLNRIKKYMPWAAPLEMSTATPTYYDPTRELAANAEQANIASQAAGMFAGPQQLAARTADIQGRAADNAANIMGKYNNLNVGVANQFQEFNTQVKNANMAAQADRANNLYRDTLITNQQFDNAKNQARQNLRNSLIQAITNRGQTQAMNSIQDQYMVDPSSGGMIRFTKGRPISNMGQQRTKEDMMNEVERLHNKGYSADLIKMLMGVH